MAQTRRQAALAAAGEPTAKRSKTNSKESTAKDGSAKSATHTSIAVGDPLPNVDVVLQNEEQLNLAEKFASGILVLFAYPKASTPGCTRQTSSFGADYPKFRELGAAVFGVSADSPKAQTTFKTKTEVDFDLISDPNFELLGPLGAKKSPRGVIRSHWVFADGKAVLVEHSVKPDDSSARTLAAVKEALGGSAPDTKADEEAGESAEPAEPAEPKAEEPAEEGAAEASRAQDPSVGAEETAPEDPPKKDVEPDAPEPFVKEDAPDREATEEAPDHSPDAAKTETKTETNGAGGEPGELGGEATGKANGDSSEAAD